MKERASLAAHSEESFENFADPSSPTISAYENLLRTPTPPEVTAIPEDIRQVSLAAAVCVPEKRPETDRGYSIYHRTHVLVWIRS